jgi:hypothetical protein
VHAGDLAVAEDVAGVGEEQTGEANREPRFVGLPKGLENLVEVCDLTDQRHRADDQNQRNRHARNGLAPLDAQNLVAGAHRVKLRNTKASDRPTSYAATSGFATCLTLASGPRRSRAHTALTPGRRRVPAARAGTRPPCF